MEKIRRVFDRIRRSPLTLDSALRKFFNRDTFMLKEFRGSFEEMMAARLAIHLRDELGCINQEIEEEGFGNIAAVIKNCPDKPKPKRKGASNADTRGQARRKN